MRIPHVVGPLIYIIV